ncbi:phage minor head protein [Streptomyces sp. NRRL B-1347]|uniref:phage minor head protein n=1 Tax=Streptomyces sp. NRRL B-1347 TaxID=1476877 RepID=UPI00055D34B7|nr:phage minor head protein [Streptomyces sp. NRRL B-1347]
MADDLEGALAAAEEDVAAEVRAILDDVAAEFAAELADATELVAARFSVSRIAGMWSRHVPRLMRRLFGAGETAARTAADSVDAQLPDDFEDLPARYDDGTLPTGLGEYAESTEHLLRAVGDRLAETAVRELATGLDAGEDIDALRARLRAVFDAEGAQLGETREERIARTEAARVWNAATLAAADALDGLERPLVKQWVTRRDSRVRDAHDAVDGFVRLLDDTFTVAGVPMAYPGDPTAPAALTVNCRCILRLQTAHRAAALESQDRLGGGLIKARPADAEHTAAADGSHRSGAMIALMPTEDDARRLAIEGGEPAEELHLTLYFLGEGADWTEDQRNELIGNLHASAAELGAPLHAFAFGAAHWNPASDTPSWVWNVGDDRDRPLDTPTLAYAHALATYALDTHERPELPVQHSPWAAHVCAAYSDDPALLGELVARTGPITFDRLRVAFAGEHTDIPLAPREEPMPDTTAAATPVRAWSTPDETAIAYEDEETGDGRIFARDSLYWDAPGPWPLQYADEMLMGHEGAELAGQIDTMGREGGRIPATGVLYATRPAGQDAIHLLEEGAPLGVSVDLDDVDMEVIDRTKTDDDGDVLVLAASLPSASVLRLADGAYMLSAATAGEWTADGGTLTRARHNVQLFTGPDGRISSAAFAAAFAGTGVLTAAAGDRDDPEQGTVVHTQHAGDVLMRITRARVRGATLVAMPAYSRARIVLDAAEETAAAAAPPALSASGDDHERVISYVRTSPVAVGARETSGAVGIGMNSARAHLARAAKAGRLVRLAPGLYAGPCTTMSDEQQAACRGLSAAASGDLDLPVHEDPDAAWDGDQAASRILAWATGEDGTVDADRLGAAFLYRDPDKDATTLAAYKLPFADLFPSGDGERLEVVARAVFAVAGVLQGAMGGVDLPEDERDSIRARVEQLYARLAEAYDDPSLTAPWDDGQDDDDEGMAASLAELEASAWSAMRDLPPMPARWFAAPTAEELPPGSGGVHYKDGRVFGWVAQAGVPHAGYPGKNLTIEKLVREGLDTTHFLRQKFVLDDGTAVRAGAFTMNVPHRRDGAECEDAACQFDDTRTVAGVVTCGLSEGGLWFTGAAAPWLSEWDMRVFLACQPSYHLMQAERGKGWELRAVLTVPVPGHSSALVAAAVDRANLALAASAAAEQDDVRTVSADASVLSPDAVRTTSTATPGMADEQGGHSPDAEYGQFPDAREVADAVVAAMLTDGEFLDYLSAALEEREAARAEMDAEIERLAAQIDPDTQHVAAALVGGPAEGGQ